MNIFDMPNARAQHALLTSTVLFLLARHDDSVYNLAARLMAVTQGVVSMQMQLYELLRELERAELVDSYTGTAPRGVEKSPEESARILAERGGRLQRYYALTEAGRRIVEERQSHG